MKLLQSIYAKIMQLFNKKAATPTKLVNKITITMPIYGVDGILIDTIRQKEFVIENLINTENDNN